MIGARLDEALERLGWRARDLCDAAVLSESCVSQIRSGQKTPSLLVALAVAEVTGWTIDALIGADPLGDPDCVRLPKPTSTASTGWAASIKALVYASSLKDVACRMRCDPPRVHMYLRGVEPRLTSAVAFSQRLGQRVHAMAIGRPAL